MLKKNMISCVVLDIDDTLVSKDCLDTVVSYVALVAGTVVLALGYVLQGVLLVALSTLRLWSLPRLPSHKGSAETNKIKAHSNIHIHR